MKKNKLLISLFFYLFFTIPLNVFAYSNYIIPGGENVGIEVNSNGILVVGFYKVSDHFIAKDSGFNIGDRIIRVNGREVFNIDEMAAVINNSGNTKIKYTVVRNNKEKEIIQDRIDIDGVYKTGLYVKDSIIGIGTLTFIDPETRKFGALGHEILERTTREKFEIKDGKIFKSDVTGVLRSENGIAGEKKANYNKSEIYGEVKENTESGIFGDYTFSLPDTNSLKVASKDDIETGEAVIRTVINNNEIREYKINILKINKDSKTKNILFEIMDNQLLEKTGGVVQGMSGSPIIQNNMIIGAVTHVIVNDTKKGYGIFITTMLEEAEN
ncbi:MAG: SpoIVB peptidase [Bacilli bacterium]|nr:SpoIVB peptidase [Bacilli bacterium]